MLDLQGIVEALGQSGKNQVQSGKRQFQTRLVVASQEKLGDVVDALGDRRIKLARLQAEWNGERLNWIRLSKTHGT